MEDPSRERCFQVRGVIFDMDGLLFDTEALFHRVAVEMLAERGKAFTAEIMGAMIGRRAVEAGEAFRRMTGLAEPAEQLLAELRARFDALVDTAVHPTPGLFALLELLERLNIPKGVATSSRREYAERLLGRHRLLPHFSFVLTGDDVTRGKPDPEIYLKAANMLSLSPRQAIVLEDSPPGIEAARLAGAFVVGVPHDHSPASGMGSANLVVPSLDAPELFDLISRSHEHVA